MVQAGSSRTSAVAAAAAALAMVLSGLVVAGTDTLPQGATPHQSGSQQLEPSTDSQPQRQNPAEHLFFEAEGLWSAGDIHRSLSRFLALVEQYPAETYPTLMWRAAAMVRAGEIQLRLGAGEAAAASFVAALDEEPTSMWTPRARLGLATALQWQGDWEAATDALQRIVSDAAASGVEGTFDASAIAARRLSLLHRLWIRPAAGQSPWQKAGRLVLGDDKLEKPVAVAASQDGKLLVVDEGRETVLLVDQAGNLHSFPGKHARRPWWGPDGLGYVAASVGVLVPERGEQLQFVSSGGQKAKPLDHIRAGVSSGTGEWLLLDSSAKKVMRFDSRGAFQGSLPTSNGVEPVDIGRDPRGWLYLIDKKSRSVLQFNRDGVLEGSIYMDQWQQPQALDVDALGNFYVLDRKAKRIDVFDAQGGIRWSLGPRLPGGVVLRDPRDLAVDGSGRLYVADAGLSVVMMIE
ncbi:MAG: tetratricopeptide repeat protein [Acidobacteriota bacterium]